MFFETIVCKEHTNLFKINDYEKKFQFINDFVEHAMEEKYNRKNNSVCEEN